MGRLRMERHMGRLYMGRLRMGRHMGRLTMIKYYVIFFSLLLLVGCGGWSKKKCSNSNFETMGYKRGFKGLKSHGDQIQMTCTKKEVSIDIDSYNRGYQRGLKAYCTEAKGNEKGRLGQMSQDTCASVDHYIKAYDRGIKTYCTVERGTKDGYSLRSKLEVCLTSSSTYILGYENGIKSYCSKEKGQEDGFFGVKMHSICANYPNYTAGYKDGIANFCMPENGLRLGEKGIAFPTKCIKSSFKSSFKASFKAAYNKGKGLFLKQRINDLNTNLDIEKRNYKNLRDELQDVQFAYKNLSQSHLQGRLTKEQRQKKRELSNRTRRLKKERDKQRVKVTEMEFELKNLKSDLGSL